MEPKNLLEKAYLQAENNVATGVSIPLEGSFAQLQKEIDIIIEATEDSKAVYTVVLTSLVYKILNPEVDIRYHQTNIEKGKGYSGRSFDTHFITPFLKEKDFPAMSESGWLTRSLEQKVPYDMEYPGAIRPKKRKMAFLSVIAAIEESQQKVLEGLLLYLFQALIIQRNNKQVTLATPHIISIAKIMQLLKSHFEYPYKGTGAARLPVLAIYSLYQIFINELSRFSRGYQLLPLEKHTSSDLRSGRCGDIDVVTNEGEPFEAVEVKFGIPITPQLVLDCYEKFKSTRMQRYYILSTYPVSEQDALAIQQQVDNIKAIHGCQVIVNGIYPSIMYYLRMVSEPALFIERYTENMQADDAIKYAHKDRWNQIVMG